ncbi:AI-2E family transporter [Aquamicrobium segne]|uniref:AI-2E family transporter n=1 Tax=Aquamicrobium segne TaxID=469547 RepID=A0ABW0GXP8_9HYPH
MTSGKTLSNTQYASQSRVETIPSQRASLPGLISLVGVSAILYLGREVFLPVAAAFLLTFALAPIVTFLRKKGLPKPAAVILTVTLTFAALGLLGAIVATQVTNLAQNIPTYQSNIITKVHSLKEMGANGGIIDRLSSAMQRIGAELQASTQTVQTDAQAVPEENPMPVKIIAQDSTIETLKNVITPLVSPFTTAGLVIVVVIFMLLEREDLRDRFIRLVGYSDVHRTTEALQEAGTRVGHYLLMQLVVNTLYAVPITAGLWLLGIPNAFLWGLLTLVLRFVPYIGPAIGMIFPLFLALAVSPGWSLLLWTAALFLIMELISGNIIEPLLYGSKTGLSPLAIIVAAIFWTWLWGPLGLLLSTPLTVCMVVLGRYVPQFEFLGVLLGNEPVLDPPTQLYQRLLSGNADEATDKAEEFLEKKYLVDYYDTIGIPALLLAEQDRQRGALRNEQSQRLYMTVQTLVTNLQEIAVEEENEEENEIETRPANLLQEEDETLVDLLPDGEGVKLLCAGGRGDIDDAAAAMLAQILEVQGATATSISYENLQPLAARQLALDKVDVVIITFLNPASASHARIVVRRLKTLRPGLRVGILVPVEGGFIKGRTDAIGADFIASSASEAVIAGLTKQEPVRVKNAPRRIARLKPPAKRTSPAPEPSPT